MTLHCSRPQGLNGLGAKESKMLPTALISAVIGFAAFGILPSDAFAMSVKFSWKGYLPCSTSSPAFVVSEVPSGAVRLSFKMVGKDLPTYPHVGGIVPFTGTAKFLTTDWRSPTLQGGTRTRCQAA